MNPTTCPECGNTAYNEEGYSSVYRCPNGHKFLHGGENYE